MSWLSGENTASTRQQPESGGHHSGCILLPVPEEKVWFEVEGIDDWSVVGNSWFDIGTPLFEKFRSRREELEIGERIAQARKILKDCGASLLRYRRRQKIKKKLKQEINKSIPTFIAARDQTKQIAQNVALPDPLQLIMGLFTVMVIFQSAILIHSMWTDHYDKTFAYLLSAEARGLDE